MIILLTKNFIFDILLSIRFNDSKIYEILFGFLEITNSMIDYASLKIIFTNIWLHFNELIETYNAVDIVPDFLVTLGFQIDESWKIFFSHLIHAIFC
jgi:hypothetical protein